MKTNPLVGKTLVGVDVADDKRAMRFRLSDGSGVVVKADGDCCSDTWIESVEMPTEIPATVLSVENIDLPGSCVSHPEYDCLQVYGLKVVTDKGTMIVDYRNSSNGYYGGNLAWPGEYFSGDVYGQNKSKYAWVEQAVS